MALDRFVHFKERCPTSEEVERIVTNYVGEAGLVSWSTDRWVVDIPGTPTSPFDGIHGALSWPMMHDKRWFEVYFQPGQPMDIITRAQDEFTTAVADQLARAFARFYKGELQMET